MIDKKTSKIISFVKRNKKLAKSKQQLIDDNVERLKPDAGFITNAKALWFEIGFGEGEHLAYQARNNPDVSFVGCEVFASGVAELIAKTRDLSNVRIHQEDAIALLEELPDRSIDRLFILFPDPWPKKRHNKRRIISKENITLFAQKLKKDGLLRIATDHTDYLDWILAQLINREEFIWQAESKAGWQSEPQDWQKTRYQEKAGKQGIGSSFLDFRSA
jgi:tRNA (guanine-N7-)-methyltransferase